MLVTPALWEAGEFQIQHKIQRVQDQSPQLSETMSKGAKKKKKNLG